VEAKDIAGPVVWGLLSEAEQKARNTAQATANKAIKDKQDKDDKEKYTDAFHKIDEKDEDQKIHFVLKYRQDKRNQEIKEKLYPVFLTGQDRYDIFKSIRWSRL
jgi:transposase-like protein